MVDKSQWGILPRQRPEKNKNRCQFFFHVCHISDVLNKNSTGREVKKLFSILACMRKKSQKGFFFSSDIIWVHRRARQTIEYTECCYNAEYQVFQFCTLLFLHIKTCLKRAHHIKMQFSKLHFGHGLFDPLIVTFQGQTFFDWVCSLRTLIPKKNLLLTCREQRETEHPVPSEIKDCPWQIHCSLIVVQ